MFRLVETIKLRDGIFENVDLHNERFNRSRESLFGINAPIDLKEHLELHQYEKTGLYKCRVVYNRQIVKTEFIPYALGQVASLKLINADIDYSYKYEDRSDINKLFQQRENCHDIIIVKNDRLTDTSAANIAFFDGDRWHTPLHPLLKGTEREKLLRSNTIFEEDIKVRDLSKFVKAAVFSTMVEFGEIVVPVSNII
jgi:4-amino-4-deoxychorismate lyase